MTEMQKSYHKIKNLDKKYFDHMIQKTKKWSDIRDEFDSAVFAKFGYHYYQTDMYKEFSPIEFGEGEMTYDQFVKLMINNTPSHIR